MIHVHPHYRLAPPGTAPTPGPTTIVLAPGTAPTPGPTTIVLAPGTGFGDGTHATTQLCLLALAYLLRITPRPLRMLDFGAGNGVLAIAAALAGATVEAVEIDERALAEAAHNAGLNEVAGRIALRTDLSEPPQPHDLVVANILVGVLVDHAPALTARLVPTGHLLLSGLTATDVPAILAAYRPLLAAHRPTVYDRGEWRAVVFAPPRA